jgi:DNA-binding transcriptional MerR regulator/methylmalonyl-CoA mutase cobalamin-binding subunit
LFNIVEMQDLTYSIKAAALKTGLNPHVIRVWEKRYGAVTPARTDSNRRHYSEAEIDRLGLLKAATIAGHGIGQVANLGDQQLRTLLQQSKPEKSSESIRPPSPQRFITDSLAAVQRLDSAGLDAILGEAAVTLGTQGLLQKMIVPLTYRIGNLWHNGDMTAAQEHFASSLIRSFLGNHARPYSIDPSAPLLVVGTPIGQHHEMGAVIVSAAASSLGWRVANLSASLPAVEIANAAVNANARAVALSIVFPEDDPNLPAELECLRRLLPKETELLAGGRAAPAYAQTLEKMGATICSDLDLLSKALQELRRGK